MARKQYEQHPTTFTGGMNKDLDVSLMKPEMYIHAENLRLVADESNSTGALENVKGNKRIISNKYGSPAYKLVGYTVNGNKAILFYRDSNHSAIYEAIFKGNELNIDDDYREVYNDSGQASDEKLGFNKDTEVTAILRKENENVEKLYWLDNTQGLRYMNIIGDPGDAAAPKDKDGNYKKVSNFTPSPSYPFRHTNINLSAIGNGSLMSGMVQYAFRFISRGGGQSPISPVTGLYHITKSNESGTSTTNYKGTATEENCNKSFIMQINIDSSSKITSLYDEIKPYSIYRSRIGSVPEVNELSSIKIEEGSYSYKFTDSGEGYVDTLSLTELLVESSSVTSSTSLISNAKLLESKDNRLFLADIETRKADLDIGDYDARAYRFNDSRECMLWDGDDNVEASFSTYGTVGNAKYSGSGSDDLTTGGIFTGSTDSNYVVEIDSIGTPDTFRWSDSGGDTWNAENLSISDVGRELNNGVTIQFSSTTGHSTDDRWEFTAKTLTNFLKEQVDLDADSINPSNYGSAIREVPTHIKTIPSSEEVTAASTTTESIEVKSSHSWSVANLAELPSWITNVNPSSGGDGDTFVISVSANDSSTERTAYLEISLDSYGDTSTFTLTQGVPSASISIDHFFSGSGEIFNDSGYVVVGAEDALLNSSLSVDPNSASWTLVNNNNSWITFDDPEKGDQGSIATGSGDSTMYIDIAPNSTYSWKYGTFSLSMDNFSKSDSFQIRQDPAYIEIYTGTSDSDTLIESDTFDEKSQTKTYRVETPGEEGVLTWSSSWYPTSGDFSTWGSTTDTINGVDDVSELSVNVERNDSGVTREALITVFLDDNSDVKQELYIEQRPESPATLTVRPSTIDVPAINDPDYYFEITIEINESEDPPEPWSLTSPDWVRNNTGSDSGEGSSVVGFIVFDNGTGSERTGNIVVSLDRSTETDTCTITQAG